MPAGRKKAIASVPNVVISSNTEQNVPAVPNVPATSSETAPSNISEPIPIESVVQVKKTRGKKAKQTNQVNSVIQPDAVQLENVEQVEQVEQIEKMENSVQPEEHKPKKRGRKPKGGKVVVVSEEDENKNKPIKLPHIILELKCHTSDCATPNLLDSNSSMENIIPFNPHDVMDLGNLNYSILPDEIISNSVQSQATISQKMPQPQMSQPQMPQPQMFQPHMPQPQISTIVQNVDHSQNSGLMPMIPQTHHTSIIEHDAPTEAPVYNPSDVFISAPMIPIQSFSELPHSMFQPKIIGGTQITGNSNYESTGFYPATEVEYIRNRNQQISEKLSALREIFHHNLAHQKRSNCFWCTQPFETQPIYIPKHRVDNVFEVYGCFCLPQCAAAFLMNEPISSSIMWERYSLLNSLYSGIYGYEKSIQPAPSPHYLLECFHGNLTIEEYRHMLSQNESLMIVDKPMARLMPELYDTNTEIPSNARIRVSSKSVQSSDYALKRKNPRKTGKEMYKEQWSSFGTNGVVPANSMNH